MLFYDIETWEKSLIWGSLYRSTGQWLRQFLFKGHEEGLVLGHMIYVSRSSAPVISLKEILMKMANKITAQHHFMNILRIRGAICKIVTVLIHETALYIRIHAVLTYLLLIKKHPGSSQLLHICKRLFHSALCLTVLLLVVMLVRHSLQGAVFLGSTTEWQKYPLFYIKDCLSTIFSNEWEHLLQAKKCLQSTRTSHAAPERSLLDPSSVWSSFHGIILRKWMEENLIQ